jgi:hypothetical protein
MKKIIDTQGRIIDGNIGKEGQDGWSKGVSGWDIDLGLHKSNETNYG